MWVTTLKPVLRAKASDAALPGSMMQGTRDTYKLQQIMRRTLGGWVARQLHRKPMIVPVVADIAQDVDDAMGLNAAK